jgi:2'-5' RNA ligase
MRTFVAIDLPEDVHSVLAQKQAAFRAVCPDARWTRSEGIHLTLKFLGEISDAQVRQVTEALSNIGRFETFVVEVKGFGFFPGDGRPRVFWAGLEAPPELSQLAARVETAMEALGFRQEQRRFSPHLTLARFNVPRPQPALQAFMAREGQPNLGRFKVSEFFLFESKLSSKGAEYRKVARFP